MGQARTRARAHTLTLSLTHTLSPSHTHTVSTTAVGIQNIPKTFKNIQKHSKTFKTPKTLFKLTERKVLLGIARAPPVTQRARRPHTLRATSSMG